MENKAYTNNELAQAYFEVIAQGSSSEKHSSYRRDRVNIGAVEENIQDYFANHGNLDDLEITKIGKVGVVGKEKRKLLERILVDGKDVVKKEREDERISLDFLR